MGEELLGVPTGDCELADDAPESPPVADVPGGVALDDVPDDVTGGVVEFGVAPAPPFTPLTPAEPCPDGAVEPGVASDPDPQLEGVSVPPPRP